MTTTRLLIGPAQAAQPTGGGPRPHLAAECMRVACRLSGARGAHPLLPRLVLAGRTVARPAHTVDDSAGRRTDVPGKSKA